MRVTTPTPLLVTSDSEKAETVAENIEAKFQPVTEPSNSAVIETVEVALHPQSWPC
jgi:hypothetical protein